MRTRKLLEIDREEKFSANNEPSYVPESWITVDAEDHQILTTVKTQDVTLISAIKPWATNKQVLTGLAQLAKESCHAHAIGTKRVSEALLATDGSGHSPLDARCDLCGTEHNDRGAALECCSHRFTRLGGDR